MSKNLTHQQLIEIADEFGTPVYVYHAERIAAQYEKLQKAFAGSNARFFYACKSLTNINILKYMQSIGVSSDSVSVISMAIVILYVFA